MSPEWNEEIDMAKKPYAMTTADKDGDRVVVDTRTDRTVLSDEAIGRASRSGEVDWAGDYEPKRR